MLAGRQKDLHPSMAVIMCVDTTIAVGGACLYKRIKVPWNANHELVMMYA